MRGRVRNHREDIEPSMQEVFERAPADKQIHYLELMRHDPVAGMAFLQALSLIQHQTEDTSPPPIADRRP
jgi:hypothetical protein